MPAAKSTRRPVITAEQSPRTTPPAAPAELSATGALWTRLVALHSRVDALVERALHRGFGIGLSEFLALSACAGAPDGEMRMQDLTDAVNLNQSSVSRMVTRLERTGLTERRNCEHDRRGVYTGITEHGMDVFRRAVPVYESVLAEALDLSAADPELAGLVEHLGALRT
ncbi:MarR family winged helix-turn-helix transcriptional regulator [Streptomonospora halophila]|uniref:MarR family winged helix-turn-helix transcriptional regulator n=1 Tax=Streptomonospora halophila TaxID=427369 RepID=UPI0031E762F1